MQSKILFAMENLYKTFYQLLSRTNSDFVRYLYPKIRWKNRLIAITETFFFNQLKTVSKIISGGKPDFKIDNKYSIESWR